MNDRKMRKRIAFIFVAILMGIPAIVMIWQPGAGALLLLIGALTAYRAIRFLSNGENESYSRFSKADTAGKTILVQVVDDFGRHLSPLEVDRRMKEAREKAGPRDTIVPVRFRVENKVVTLEKQNNQNS